MGLIRLIVLESLIHNTRVFIPHVRRSSNNLADSLSCWGISKFKSLAETNGLEFDEVDTKVPNAIWPPEKIWTTQ